MIGNGLARPAGDGRWELAATPPISTYLVTLVAGRTTASAPSITASRSACTPGSRWPGACAGTRRDPRRHPGLLRPLPGDLRRAVPVRLLRPGVRPRAGVRGDGEPRLRDVPGRFPVPVRRDPGRAAARGHGDRARDGAHVVRRPGHHALVERRVAERVVRRVPGLPGAGGRHRLHRDVDRLRAGPQDPRLRRGPAGVRAPGRAGAAGGARHRRRPGRLRRHLLRQGRLRAAPAGRLAGLARLPGRDQRLLRPLPVRLRRPWRTCSTA